MKFKIKYDMEQKLVQKLHYGKAGAFKIISSQRKYGWSYYNTILKPLGRRVSL